MLTCTSYEKIKTTNVEQPSGEHDNILGCTTATISGLPGIKGVVRSALHKPSGQTVAVKIYKLDVEKADCNSCHTSQEKFNEDVTFIMVRKYGRTLE